MRLLDTPQSTRDAISCYGGEPSDLVFLSCLVYTTVVRPAVDWMPLLPIEVVCFQEFGPEILWRRGDVWSTVWRKVHEIPIRPHRVNVIPRQFSSPEMEHRSIALHEHMHHWPLHVV